MKKITGDVVLCKRTTSPVIFLANHDDLPGRGLSRYAPGGLAVIYDQGMPAWRALERLAVSSYHAGGGVNV